MIFLTNKMKYNPLKDSAKCRNDKNWIYFIKNSAVYFLLHKGGGGSIKRVRGMYFSKLSTKKIILPNTVKKTYTNFCGPRKPIKLLGRKKSLRGK